MLLSYYRLHRLIEDGVICNADPENVNGSSIDIRLGNTLLVEDHPETRCPSCGAEMREQHDLDITLRRDRNVSVYCPICSHNSRYADCFSPIDITKKQPLKMHSVDCTGEDGFIIWPRESVLAQSVEMFYLPDNITAEYRLKSSMGRVFLEHLHAGWCDPMWQGSVLTLELSNMSKYHPIRLQAGMKIGQMCFYEHEPVPHDRSYAVRGQYNYDTKVTASKGMR
jgi:dCTP deaminase